MKKLAAAALGISLVMSLSGTAQAQALTPIKISYQPSLYWALPFHIATEKGWWKDVGLAPEFSTFPAGVPQIAASAAGSWDVGGTGSVPAVLGHVRFAANESLQSIVCSKHHSLTQQLAKWILNMHDKNHGGALDFSHSEIAHLLGFRREGVTVALGLLEAAHLISMKSKQLELLNHAVLEQIACECYHEMRKQDPCSLV